MRVVETRLTARETAKFTSIVALSAMFFDAALGHALLWANDPYWTYWITKTLLVATVFGLGTAWLGIGVGRGAAITAVHTLVLTVYYWSLSPVGLPGHPEWLDLEHTWGTGVPVHFGVIYLGYLTALWVWRRRHLAHVAHPSPIATSALVQSVVIVAAAGALTTLALGQFPGVTWLVTRLLISFTLLFGWWSAVGRDVRAAVPGGVLLALAWAVYGQYLGPSGLPDAPLRLLDAAPPSASVRWPTFRELWLVSFPIHLIVAEAVLVADALRVRPPRLRALVAAFPAVVPVAMLLAAPAWIREQTEPVTLDAVGVAQLETGAHFGGTFEATTATIRVAARDVGGRNSPLAPGDRLRVDAHITTPDGVYEVEVRRPMVADPLGRFTTWRGVGLDVHQHGRSGIGTDLVAPVRADLAAYGLGVVSKDGTPIASSVPVHVIASTHERPGRLELDVGDPEAPVPGLPAGHLRVVWPALRGEISVAADRVRTTAGALVVGALVAAALALNRAELRPLSFAT